MIETKEQLIEIVSEILSTKAFTTKAKNNLQNAILFAFENYHPPKYVKTTLQEYMESYLNVLKELNGYATIELSEINDENEACNYFKESIRENSFSPGNLDFIDGKYVPCENGKYECACKGFAQNKEKQFFSLNENNPIEELVTIIHEMTHLTEGKYPFLVDYGVPLSFELRKMLYEGRASLKESYIQKSVSYVETEYLEGSMDSYCFQSKYSYPLYNQLYQTLQIIFGDEFLEEMSHNMDSNIDTIEEARKRFPKIPVHEIFAHIIYILSCQTKTEHSVLVSAIQECARFRSRELGWIQEKMILENKNLVFLKNSLKESNEEEEKMKIKLETPDLLKEEYKQAKESAKKELEELLLEGYYDEIIYKSELEKLETEGTFEYYQGLQEKELISIQNRKEYTKKAIAECIESIKELEIRKEELEQNHFALILERVCLKNPSLNSSFSFLKERAFIVVREDANRNHEIEASKDKVKALLEIEQARIINELDMKNNLVS